MSLDRPGALGEIICGMCGMPGFIFTTVRGTNYCPDCRFRLTGWMELQHPQEWRPFKMTPDNEAKVTEHMPTPWKAERPRYSKIQIYREYEDGSMCGLCAEVPRERPENAEFIVRAVNTHDELLKALRELRWKFEDEIDGVEYIDSLIARAEGRPE